MNRFLALAALAVLMLLMGCASRESKLVGNWKGQANLEGSNPMAGLAQTLAGNLTLNLKADKTFEANAPVPIGGTWSLEESELVLQPNAGGMMTNPIRLTVAEDNQSLRMPTPMMSGADLVLVRSE
jgi:uncharacterized lipoprotein NlpE involved in copper resistance